MANHIYFEANDSSSTSAWYLRVGKVIEDFFAENEFDVSNEAAWYEPDFCLKVSRENEWLEVVLVVYDKDPIRGSITMEGGSVSLWGELQQSLAAVIRGVTGVVTTKILSLEDFRTVMGWKK